MDSSKAKAEATKKAKALLKRMKTKGWKARVHENMGWHYSILNGGLVVHTSYWKNKYSYSAMLGSDPGSGDGVWTRYPGRNFTDPNKAVQDCVEHARQILDGYAEILEAAEEVVTTKV